MQSCKMTMLCAIVVCCIVFCGSGEVKVDIVEDIEPVTINPGEYLNVSLHLAQNETLYARFRIIDGEYIYFFILDQDGQDAIMNGSEPIIRYKRDLYPAQGGRVFLPIFQAPHDSTWYVWWSKMSDAPFSDSAATIEGRVGRETDGPVILETHIPDGPLTGIIEVSFKVCDEGFYIGLIELRANDTTVAETYYYHETRYINGTEAEGVIIWDTTQSENSVYVLKLVAYDALDHVSESAGVLRTIKNGFWDYSTNRLLVTVIVLLAPMLSFAWYYKLHNTRPNGKVKAMERSSWVSNKACFIIILLVLLLLLLGWFSGPVIFL